MTVAVAGRVVVVAIIDPNSGGPGARKPLRARPSRQGAIGFVPYAVFSGFVFAGLRRGGRDRGAGARATRSDGFLGVGALLWSLGVLSSDRLLAHGVRALGPSPRRPTHVAVAGDLVFLPAFVLLLCLVPLLFPTGSPPAHAGGWSAGRRRGGRRRDSEHRLRARAAGQSDFPGWTIRSASRSWSQPLAGASFVAVAVARLAGLVSLVVRYRRAQGMNGCS